MRRILLCIAAGVLMAPCGCSSRGMISASAVRLTWDVIGPEYRAYVEADQDLSDAARETKMRTADLFEAVLREAEN